MTRTKSATWFEAKVRYRKVMETGSEKMVTDTYAIDSLSFTETEKKTIEYVKPFVNGDYEILSMGYAAYKEVVFSDDTEADKYYKVKTAYITIDEKTAQEKRSTVTYLVQGKSLEDARKNIEDTLKNGMIDFEVSSVVETKVLDVVEA